MGVVICQDIVLQCFDLVIFVVEVSVVVVQIEDFNYCYFFCKDCFEYFGIWCKCQNEIMVFYDELLLLLRCVIGVVVDEFVVEDVVEDVVEGDFE